MKQGSLGGGFSESNSFINNLYERMSIVQSKVWSRGSLFSRKSKHSMVSMMNKEIRSSGLSYTVKITDTKLMEEEIKSTSTLLERLSIDKKSNISMVNDCDSSL